METNGAQVKKPPSRKQRRKPSTLRKKESRLRREHKWLETHLWHAKRMKMVNRYGFRLADHCNDKGVRAAYRSLVHGCLLSVSEDIFARLCCVSYMPIPFCRICHTTAAMKYPGSKMLSLPASSRFFTQTLVRIKLAASDLESLSETVECFFRVDNPC